MAETEVYRLKLEAGAINEEGNKDNDNEAIAPKDQDIIIEAAPALDAENGPYLSGQNIIVTFDGPIVILNTEKIKYQLDGKTTTPTETPTVINNNQLTIPLNKALADDQVYLIDLEAGAIIRKNTAPTTAIRPEGKEIKVWLPDITEAKPVFTSKKKFSFTFPVDVEILGDGSAINVQKKDDGSKSFTTMAVASRTITVEDKKKINITLTGAYVFKETTIPYTQVWRVVFPANTVQSATSKIPNSSQLTTGEGSLKLTDFYSWKKISQRGSKWPARNEHTSVVFDPDGNGDRIWVLGGITKEPDSRQRSMNDVWSSTDGKAWIESEPQENGITVTKKTAGPDKNWWPARRSHTSVVFDPDGNGDRIWVLGGWGESGLNDVWSSPDGKNWVESKPPDNAARQTAGARKKLVDSSSGPYQRGF